MDPSVQFDPGRCVLVLGPQIAAASLALKELGAPAALSYSTLFEVGMQKMLELDPSQSKEEKIRKQTLLAGAYELEPSFVANKVVESLRSHDKYEQWLTDMFSSLYNLPVHSGPNSVVEDLKHLQEKGVLLVYSYYDMILDHAMDSAPILMEEEDVKNWGSHKMPGILHVHGVHSHPSSVMCDCVNYDKVVVDTNAGRRLKEICRNRTVLFIGFDGRFYDPFLPKFASNFLSGAQAHSTALLLTFTGSVTNHPSLLKVKLSSNVGGICKFLVPTLSPYKPAPREGVDPSKSLNTTLLFADKSSCSDAAEKVKTMPAIKVHQLTISHEQQSHQLLLYLDQEGLRNLWKVLFNSDNSQSSLHSGLLGVVLDSGVTVWCKSVPKNDANISHSGTMDTSATSSVHPTLSTTVSLIGSMWTPIATPSVVSQQQPPKQLLPSTSTRPTLPSPLITSHSSLGLNTKGLTPELPRHVGLLTPHHAHNRREVRRVQSERYNLSYQDRINDMKATGKKNGVLIHRESAPEFVYTSEGTVAYRADSFHGSSPHHLHAIHKPSSVSQPSPLVKDGSNLELKIEYIDQFQRSKSPGRHPPQGALQKGGSGHAPREGVSTVAAAPATSEGSMSSSLGEKRSSFGGSVGLEKKEMQGRFVEEKQKWIKDAMNWSKKVSTEIQRVSSQQMLGNDRNRSSLLNTNISPEEQEKILQQHFDLVKSQQQQQQQQPKLSGPLSGFPLASTVTTGGGAPVTVLPLSSLSSLSPSSRPTSSGIGVQTPPSSKLPHPSPRHSPNLSPLQLAAATAAAAAAAASSSTPPSGSPKKSPVNPLLLGGGVGGSGGTTASGVPPQTSSSIFSYFPSATNPALQSPAAASFLFNPAVSQYAAAAAMFNNPFQAAIQLLSPQGNNNNKPQAATTPAAPMLLTDPSVLQSLQQSLPDKVPCILSDGSITFVPTNFGATPPPPVPPPPAAISTRESPIPMSLKSPNLKTGGGGVGVDSLKRLRSPDDDPIDIRPSMPKRRRSSSLPDIAQLSQLDMKVVSSDSIREDEERERDRERENEREVNSKLARPQLLVKQPQHRQTPPPNMIQIPQDVKLNDPMLSFPTPPQSSPLIGNLAFSPFVLPTPTFQNATPMTPVTPQEPLSTEELRELVEASGGGQTNLPPSPEGTSLPPFPAGRGPIQLWQFLLDLLLAPDKQHMIQWTGNGYEFRILAPEDIAKLWGARKNKPRMNYDKLSRGLRYYYSKGIMDKVPGKKLTFKYTCDVQHYVRSRSAQAMRSSNFPNGTSTPGSTTGGAVAGGGIIGVASSASTPSIMPGGITIAASAVAVNDGSKQSSHRLDSISTGSPELDEERNNSINIILPQTSNIPSEAEFCQLEEV